jgi:hypothetical protein
MTWIAVCLLILILLWQRSRTHKRLATNQAQINLMSIEINKLENMQSRVLLTVLTAGERGKAAPPPPTLVPVQQTNGRGHEALSD